MPTVNIVLRALVTLAQSHWYRPYKYCKYITKSALGSFAVLLTMTASLEQHLIRRVAGKGGATTSRKALLKVARQAGNDTDFEAFQTHSIPTEAEEVPECNCTKPLLCEAPSLTPSLEAAVCDLCLTGPGWIS